MLILSLFTPNGRYPELAKRLTASCERLKLPNRMVEIADMGQWRSSAAAKASLILQMLIDLRRPILWVDADCEIMQLPAMFWQGEHDFAVYNWRADPANTMEAEKVTSINSLD